MISFLIARDLPENPDIVLPKYKTIIFVHGCFWHGCPTCKHASVRPKANAEYWDKKLERNVKRDKEKILELEKRGWHILVVWECETKKSNLIMLTKRLKNYLSEIKG